MMCPNKMLLVHIENWWGNNVLQKLNKTFSESIMAPKDEKEVDKIFAGCLDNLPALSSKVVRIFTSSTFTDMLMERNTLMEWVYPKIKVSSDEFLKCHNTLYCNRSTARRSTAWSSRWWTCDGVSGELLTSCLLSIWNHFIGHHCQGWDDQWARHHCPLYERVERMSKV